MGIGSRGVEVLPVVGGEPSRAIWALQLISNALRGESGMLLGEGAVSFCGGVLGLAGFLRMASACASLSPCLALAVLLRCGFELGDPSVDGCGADDRELVKPAESEEEDPRFSGRSLGVLQLLVGALAAFLHAAAVAVERDTEPLTFCGLGDSHDGDLVVCFA